MALTKQEIVDGLKQLGVREGTVVMAHSALSAFGEVEGGAVTVIEALIEAVGPEGTLLMPAMASEQPFRIASSPSTVGTITDVFRSYAGTTRSLHPTHSVAGIGPMVDQLIAGHIDQPTALGPQSPWGRMAQRDDAYILLLGCDQDRNTLLHCAEEAVDGAYLNTITRRYIDSEGHEQTKVLEKFPGPHRDFIGLDSLFENARAMNVGKIGTAVCRLMSARQTLMLAIEALRRDPAAVRSRIGLSGQYAAVDERLSGFENLQLVGRMFHLHAREARRRARELLDRFSLTDAGDRVVKGYSGGMRRRLDIAMSLIAEPSVLFLDEPTTGLDPRSRLEMWEVIDRLVEDGTTTLLTTQYLDEAERLADDIAVIDRGTVIARGTASELKARSGGVRVEVTLKDPNQLGRVPELLGDYRLDQVSETIDPAASMVTVPVRGSDGIVPAVVRSLDLAGIEVLDVVVRRPTLDDVFLELTGHRAEEQDGEDADSDTDATGGTPR